MADRLTRAMSDVSQKVLTLEQRITNLEKELAQQRVDAEANHQVVVDKAESILQALVGTLTVKGLIPKYNDLEKLMFSEIRPRVDTLWNDRVRLVLIMGGVTTALAAGLSALLTALGRKFL